MSKITDYSNFYRELSTAFLKDTHWILDLSRTAKKKNRDLKIFFETDELSEKSLSFLLFRQHISRDGLWNFLEWLEEEEFFFDYGSVFEKFDEMFLRASLKCRDAGSLEPGEIPGKVRKLADHWNFWLDILHWTRKLCFNQPYWQRFMEGGDPWSIPVLSDRSKW